MEWAEASNFLHGKAKRAAEKGKEAAWKITWPGLFGRLKEWQLQYSRRKTWRDGTTGYFQLSRVNEMVKGCECTCVEGLSGKPALHMCMCPRYGKQYLSSPCYHLSPGLPVGPARKKKVFTRLWEVVELLPRVLCMRILTTGPRLPCLICDMSGDGPIGPIDPRGPGCPGGPGDPGTPWLPFGPGAPAIDSKGYPPGKAFRTPPQCKQWGLIIFWTTQWTGCLNTSESTTTQPTQKSSETTLLLVTVTMRNLHKTITPYVYKEVKTATARWLGTQTENEKKSRNASFSHKEEKNKSHLRNVS